MANRLTRAQQHALAGAVIAEVGQLIEFWDEKVENCYSDLNGIDFDDARHQLAVWMRRLPGDAWDVSLPDLDRESDDDG